MDMDKNMFEMRSCTGLYCITTWNIYQLSSLFFVLPFVTGVWTNGSFAPWNI